MSDAGGTGDPTETLEMDWARGPQASQQNYMANLNPKSGWGKNFKRGRPRNTWRRHLEADVKYKAKMFFWLTKPEMKHFNRPLAML